MISNQNEIIQIELYKYNLLTTKKLIQVIGISFCIALLINAFAYYYFDMNDLLLLLIAFSITITLTLISFQLNHFYTTTNIILIIAFEELQLMSDNKILWCEKIRHLDFQVQNNTSIQISILTITGTVFSEILIGYGRPKKSNQQQQVDYLIFSKLDWQILTNYTKQNLLKVNAKTKQSENTKN